MEIFENTQSRRLHYQKNNVKASVATKKIIYGYSLAAESLLAPWFRGITSSFTEYQVSKGLWTELRTHEREWKLVQDKLLSMTQGDSYVFSEYWLTFRNMYTEVSVANFDNVFNSNFRLKTRVVVQEQKISFLLVQIPSLFLDASSLSLACDTEQW